MGKWGFPIFLLIFLVVLIGIVNILPYFIGVEKVILSIIIGIVGFIAFLKSFM